MRKTIALVLSVLMIATILPVGIFAADEKQVGKVNLRFDFEGDTSWANTYFNNHKGASPVTFEGSKESSKNGVTTFYWGKYVTEEDGNTYSYCDKSAGNGYAIRNESGYDNFGDYVRLSFRAKFNSLSNTKSSVMRGQTCFCQHYGIFRAATGGLLTPRTPVAHLAATSSV